MENQRFRIGTLVVGVMSAMAAGCAVPATEVAVDTMPMRKALEVARADAMPNPALKRDTVPPEKRVLPPALQGSILSTPDVRLAYLYESIDAEGNKHYGEWVAIPLSGSRWVMSDGTQTPIDPNAGEAAAAPESP